MAHGGVGYCAGRHVRRRPALRVPGDLSRVVRAGLVGFGVRYVAARLPGPARRRRGPGGAAHVVPEGPWRWSRRPGQRGGRRPGSSRRRRRECAPAPTRTFGRPDLRRRGAGAAGPAHSPGGGRSVGIDESATFGPLPRIAGRQIPCGELRSHVERCLRPPVEPGRIPGHLPPLLVRRSVADGAAGVDGRDAGDRPRPGGCVGRRRLERTASRTGTVSRGPRRRAQSARDRAVAHDDGRPRGHRRLEPRLSLGGSRLRQPGGQPHRAERRPRLRAVSALGQCARSLRHRRHAGGGAARRRNLHGHESGHARQSGAARRADGTAAQPAVGAARPHGARHAALRPVVRPGRGLAGARGGVRRTHGARVPSGRSPGRQDLDGRLGVDAAVARRYRRRHPGGGAVAGARHPPRRARDPAARQPAAGRIRILRLRIVVGGYPQPPGAAAPPHRLRPAGAALRRRPLQRERLARLPPGRDGGQGASVSPAVRRRTQNPRPWRFTSSASSRCASGSSAPAGSSASTP